MYAPMTKEQFRPFNVAMHAARGSFKPMRFTIPTNARYSDANVTLIHSLYNSLTLRDFFARDDITGGERVIRVDGLPPSATVTPAFSSGHAIDLNTSNAQGGIAMPIHDVKTNEYGEANMRINNGVPQALDYGHTFDRDVTTLDVIIDGNSIDVKVDSLGFHYLELDMITTRIF
jgi:hypothetical protein